LATINRQFGIASWFLKLFCNFLHDRVFPMVDLQYNTKSTFLFSGKVKATGF